MWSHIFGSGKQFLLSCPADPSTLFLKSLKSDFLSLWGSIAKESIIVSDILQSILAGAALINTKDENAIAPQLIFILFLKSYWVF